MGEGWYGTNFLEFDSDAIDYNNLEKSVSDQKKDGRGHLCPSFFGMTTTQAIRDLFVWSGSYIARLPCS